MATIQELKELALHAAKGTAPSNFTAEDAKASFAAELKAMAGTVNQFMKNRYDIYEIMIETIDEVVPNKVISAMGMFADVQTVGQGQKAIFKRKLGKNRAKKFLTRVGLSGVYETFRLDVDYIEVGAYAIGGGVSIDFERLMDGAEDMAELMEIMSEGLVDSAYIEVQKALVAAYSAAGVPAANRASDSAFDGDHLMKIISTVRAYGTSAVVLAAPEFVADMGPDAIVPATANYGGVYHPQDIDAIHNTGYINIFRGTPIVQLPQSFIDEKNVKTWINPQYAYVLPTGGEKVVKVVVEGPTFIKDHDNYDNSMEVHFWKKMGAAIFTYHNWGIYQNTNVADNSASPYGI